MAIGPGKYDPECELVRKCAYAKAAAVIVLGGDRGNGFSVTALAGVHGSVIQALPQMLRHMADQIERDMAPKGSA